MSVKNESLKPNTQKEAIISLQLFQDGSMNLQSPMPPKEVIKLLQNICVELLFRALQEKETSRIVVPDPITGEIPSEVQ